MTGVWSTRLVPEQHSRKAAHSDRNSTEPHGKKITRLGAIRWNDTVPKTRPFDLIDSLL